MVYRVKSLFKVQEGNCIDKAAVDVQRPAICSFDQCSNCGVECAKTRLVTTEKFVFVFVFVFFVF